MNNSSLKTLTAITFAVAALFVIMNLVVSGAPVQDWWLGVLLLALAVGFGISAWSDGRAPKETEMAVMTSPVISVPQETQTPVVTTPASPSVVSVPKAAETVVATPPEPPPVIPAAEPDEGPADDLTLIEGIGPKISAALVAGNIRTFAQLANTPADDIRAVLKAAGITFAPSLTTWAEQAGYAARRDWEELKAFQKHLAAGRKA